MWNAASGPAYKGNSIVRIQHIPNLPNEEEARKTLERLAAEFGPIIEKRGWRVLALTEMCCCGDGDVHLSGRRKGRGNRIMSHNVQGYNVAKGDAKTSLGIHVRLRQVKNHWLIPYSEVAAVMAHELAHIRVGDHSVAFYELMEEISKQHAIFVASGNVLDKDGFPMGGEARRLGGLSRRLDTSDINYRAAIAAEKRMKVAKIFGGSNMLGGKKEIHRNKLSELTVKAAERRITDSTWCHAVDKKDVIEIFDETDNIDDVLVCQPVTNEVGLMKRKAEKSLDGGHQQKLTLKRGGSKIIKRCIKGKRKGTLRETSIEVIDLTNESGTASMTEINGERARGSELNLLICQQCTLRNNASSRKCDACNFDLIKGFALKPSARQDWKCKICTYNNFHEMLSCDMCGASKMNKAESMLNAKEVSKEDLIENIKSSEGQNSVLDFGFNIYGKQCKATSTMNHMT